MPVPAIIATGAANGIGSPFAMRLTADGAPDRTIIHDIHDPGSVGAASAVLLAGRNPSARIEEMLQGKAGR